MCIYQLFFQSMYLLFLQCDKYLKSQNVCHHHSLSLSLHFCLPLSCFATHFFFWSMYKDNKLAYYYWWWWWWQRQWRWRLLSLRRHWQQWAGRITVCFCFKFKFCQGQPCPKFFQGWWNKYQLSSEWWRRWGMWSTGPRPPKLLVFCQNLKLVTWIVVPLFIFFHCW